MDKVQYNTCKKKIAAISCSFFVKAEVVRLTEGNLKINCNEL